MPCGGDLPFRPNRGVANYYGVGGYRRPGGRPPRRGPLRRGVPGLLQRAGRERHRGDAPRRDRRPRRPPSRWKAGVPRDAGTGWDFEDVRDHYLALLYGVDPGELRRIDHDRYLEASRAVTGEVMAEVFGEWRRAGSPCGGGARAVAARPRPGAGWGVIDHRGEPKVAYHHLRRALAPVAVWTIDEGLGGVVAHVANDRPTALAGRLRVALYRDFEHRVDEAQEIVELAPHSTRQWDIEALLGISSMRPGLTASALRSRI